MKTALARIAPQLRRPRISASTSWRRPPSRELAVADKTPEPGLIEINYQAPEESTDPQPFQHHEEVTVRRCSNCGQEIAADDTAVRRSHAAAFNAVYSFLLSRGLTQAEATAIVDGARAQGGFDLI